MLVKRPVKVGPMHGDLLISCEVGIKDGGRLAHESANADRWNRAPFQGEASQHPGQTPHLFKNHGRLTVR
jgi:hypothetical protein